MNEAIKLDKSNIEVVMRLTPMQEGILFHYLKNPAGLEYVERLRIVLRGDIDYGIFRESWELVVRKNQALRTVFRWEKLDTPVQVVLKDHSCDLSYYDLSDPTGDVGRGFDLLKVPFRVALVRISSNSYEMVVNHHHILYDGWSNGILLREFFLAYSSLRRGVSPELPEKRSFAQYIEYLDKCDIGAASGFWANYLDGMEHYADLPLPIGGSSTACHRSFSFEMDSGLLNSLGAIARSERVTLASVYYGAWGLLLQRYMNCGDVVFGTSVSGRPAGIAGIDNMTGLFINTLPLRVREVPTDNMRDFIERLDSQIRERDEYDYSSLVEIKSYSGVRSGEELFKTLVVVENYPLDRQALIQDDSVQVESIEDTGRTNYDLVLSAGGILGDNFRLKFRGDRFAEADIQRMAAHYMALLEKIAANPEALVSSIELLSGSEKRKILEEFNSTAGPCHFSHSLSELFLRQVEKTPDSKAIEGPCFSIGSACIEVQLSYSQLSERVDLLSRALSLRGDLSGSIVAVVMERSVEMVTAILAILKVGAAYLPISPDIPCDRLKYMVRDSASPLVVTQNLKTGNINDTLFELFGHRMVYADRQDDTLPQISEQQFFIRPNDPAYLIYTSGSTGSPKGVIVRQDSVANLVSSQRKNLGVSFQDRILQFSAITFDASVEQIFLPLLSGAVSVLISRETLLDVEVFFDYVLNRQVTHLHAVPSFLSNLPTRKPMNFNRVLSGGDVCPPSLARKFLEHCDFYNRYGPTEVTVTALEYLARDIGASDTKVPIGKPLHNVGVYVLDYRRCLVPIGAVGELYIAGAGLATGYLNDPELTAERFVTVDGIEESRLYRTGDLGRWLGNGNVEFLGRVDRQVKVRGYRIELGEIEAHMTAFNGIREAVVLADTIQTGDVRLWACFVADDPISDRALTAFLAERLPDYMIPASFNRLEKMPLTSSGKVDRDRLPGADFGAKDNVQGPRDFVEELLIGIWADLLGVPSTSIGVNSNFFQLGGHSLSAASLISKIHRRLDKKISLGQFFKTPTIRGLSNYMLALAHQRFGAIEAVEKKEYFPLTGSQERLFATQELNRNTMAYNLPFVAQLEGDIIPSRLQQVFNLLIRRHESLRTCFRLVDGYPVQCVLRDVELTVQYQEMGDCDGGVSIIESFPRPFDLSVAPLLRVGLAKEAQEKFLLLVDMHHIVADGLSLAILLEDFIALYNGGSLSPLAVCYQDYQYWRTIQAQSGNLKNQFAFWEQEFSGDLPVLNLPTDFPRPSRLDFSGRSLRFTIDRRMTEGLKGQAHREGATLYMMLLAIYYLLLAYLSDQEDIIIGTPVAGRRHADLERVIGMFVNTLALRGNPAGRKTFTQFLKEVKYQTLNALENQDVPFGGILRQLNIARDLTRNPLFDCFFSFFEGVTASTIQNHKLDGIAITPLPQETRTSKFDLSLFAEEKEEELHLTFEYRTSLFSEATIQRFKDCFVTMAVNVLSAPSGKIAGIEGISSQEKEKILDMCHGSSATRHSGMLHRIFERQAQKTPDAVAVIYKHHKLTYRGLLEQAMGVARLLKGFGICSGDIVAIMSKRTPAMLSGLLGIMMSGGTYVPIDPGFPKVRVRFMLDDSAARLLLAGEPGIETLYPDVQVRLLEPQVAVKADVIDDGDERDAAYIIYTSGSTGNPKGVMVEHRSVSNRLFWGQKTFPLDRNDVVIQKTPYIFDVSVYELFWWPLAGASVCLLPHGSEANPAAIVETVQKERITVIHFIPSMLAAFLDYVEGYRFSDTFSMPPKVFASGEALGIREVEQFFHLFGLDGGPRLINLYGPTEAAIEVSFFDCSEAVATGMVPIGKPIDNMALVVVDKHMRLKPIGIPGELCIAGIGLARGYVNRPDLTTRKFVLLPGTDLRDTTNKVYQTGDLCRLLPHGNIEYLGRLDHQVKIRGYRIELGEIENHLADHPLIGRVAVVTRQSKGGDWHLCAFFESIDSPKNNYDKKQFVSELREHLSLRLPGYMIPDVFQFMDQLPKTASGKLDRKRLPVPNFRKTDGSGALPGSELEELMAGIWRDVLGLETVGIDDHFFGIGGDSIKAIQVVSRLHKKNMRVGIDDIVNHPTIRRLSQLVKPKTRPGKQELVIGEVSLAPIQRWFFRFNDSTLHHFNQAVALRHAQGFRQELVEKVMDMLTRHHDALRSVFSGYGQSVKQRNRGIEGYLYSIEVETLAKESDWKDALRRETKRFHGSFNLETGPLVKCVLLKGFSEDILVFIIHHLVMDGVSWRILLEDFVAGYARLAEGKAFQLPAKTGSYKLWTRQLQLYANSDELFRQLDFWYEMESHPVQKIPRDCIIDDDDRRYKHVCTLEALLSEVDSSQLAIEGRRVYNAGIEELLLTALALAISGWCGSDTIAIGMEGHGREQIFKDLDLSRTIGWFTSRYPLVFPVRPYDDVSIVLRRVKTLVHALPQRGAGYGILKYLSSLKERGKKPLTLNPEIFFNYHGDTVADFDGDDVSLVGLGDDCGHRIHPQMRQPFLLDFNVLSSEGRFQVAVSYNHMEYSQSSIRKILELFRLNLLKIWEHCSGCHEKVLVPCDVVHPSLPEEVYDQVATQINGIHTVQAIYPLTPMQHGLLFHQLEHIAPDLYSVQTEFVIRGHLDFGIFQECVNQIVRRHEGLRGNVIYRNVNVPCLGILDEMPIEIPFEDISAMPGDRQQTFLETFKRRDRKKGFKLSGGPLFRIFLFRLSDNSFRLIWNFHHILMDGWCLGIIFKELILIYRQLKELETQPLTHSPTSGLARYFDWVAMQDREEGLRFWSSYLQGFDEPSSFQGNRQKLRFDDAGIVSHKFQFDSDISMALTRLAQRNYVTMNAVFQALWGLLLQYVNNTGDVVYGAVASGRPGEIEDVEHLVGLFINTLPVRIQERGEENFLQLVSRLHNEGIKIRRFEHIPLVDIISQTTLKGNLFDHLLVFENYPVSGEIEAVLSSESIGFTVDNIVSSTRTNYDFMIVVSDERPLKISIDANAALVDENFLKIVARRILHLAREVCGNPESSLGRLDMLPPQERTMLVDTLNLPSKEFSGESIPALWQRQVARTPHHIALIGPVLNKRQVGEELQLTYNALGLRVNRLSLFLRAKGVGPEAIVAVFLDRSVEMIIAILAILEAGGCYLPMDPELPERRRDFLFRDSHALLWITQRSFIQQAESIIFMDDQNLFPESEEAPDILSMPSHLAYIIFTSGSTGRPKGVMVEQRSVVNLIESQTRTFGIETSDRILQFSSIGFDASVEQIFLAFFNGAGLVLAEKDLLLNEKVFNAFLVSRAVTHLHAVPSFLQNLSLKKNLPLRRVIAGGDECPMELARKFSWVSRFFNEYGPTETTVTSVECQVEPHHLNGSSLPIGRAVDNTTLYILDRRQRLTPLAAAGELYIGGLGVARGYLNEPVLTSEKFVLSPLGDHSRLYRTGDLARWSSDGSLEFLGRLDQQIKIRGYRIECGEIEHTLKNCNGIDDALVVARRDKKGDTYLCAYIVGIVGARQIDIQPLRSRLGKVLPQYMIPSAFLWIPQIPLNDNGKVDRLALPDPVNRDIAFDAFVPPYSTTEVRLAKIWEEILNNGRAGALDHFFETGGHSLNAMTLSSRIQKEFGKELPLKQIFAAPTLREIAGAIDLVAEESQISVPLAEKKSFYSASSAQKRMFMLNDWNGGGSAYHISTFLDIEGELDVDLVTRSFKEIVRRHDGLRTSFHLNNTIEQQVHGNVPFSIDFIELPVAPTGKFEEDRLMREMGMRYFSPFDLSAPPLMRIGLVRLEHGRYWLILNMHHIISDGISNGMITEEFRRLYMGEVLKPLVYQYCDFSEWQHLQLKNGALDGQKQYWMDVLADEIPVLNLPEDFPRPAVQSFAGNSMKKSLDRGLSRKLRELAFNADATLYMVLLAGYSILLSRYSGQEDIVVGTAVAGRPQSDFDHVVGLFVNTLALRFSPLEAKLLGRYLEEVRDVTIAAFENQHYPFEELIERLELSRDPGRNPLFDTLFVRQNIELQNLDIPGLSIQPVSMGSLTSKFDLSFFVNDEGEEIEFVLEYCTDLFTSATIGRFWDHYCQLLSQLADRTDVCLGELELLDACGKQRILEEFNNTDRQFPMETVHNLFAMQVQRCGDSLAVVQGERQASYSELEKRSGFVASFLESKTCGAGNIVGIMAERGIEAVIGLLGILKSGQAYLPIDPTYPEERKKKMLRDSQVDLLLTTGEALRCESRSYRLEDIIAHRPSRSMTNALPSQPASSLAYILYTSGSEGRPKGVMVEHRSIVRLVRNTDYIEFRADDRILQTGALEFDASTFEIWGSLLNGLVLCLVDRETILSAEELKEVINRYRVRTLWLTAPLFNQLLDTGVNLFGCLRNLLVGGDALSVPHINRLIALYPDLNVINGYGPTENTTFSTTYKIRSQFKKSIPIGGPIANSTCYVLNRSGLLLGAGMAGELYVGGAGVSRGYLNDPQLTAQKFIHVPAVAGERLYRTGDLVRWLDDGTIEYLGRMDQQVKIRGNRVELGEIEQRLMGLDSIKDAVVVSRKEKSGQKDLLAYIVPKERDASLDNDMVRDYLYGCLPGYMVPSFFVQLAEIPLTLNGKVDRKSLPEPVIESDSNRNCAQDQWQRRLSSIWAAALGLPHQDPDIDGNFFSLGGHSLKATLLVGKIHKEFNVKISTVDIFRRPSIRLLARFLRHAHHHEFYSIKPVEKSEYYPLSSAQNRLRVLNRVGERSTVYNVPSVFKIKGRVDRRKLEVAFSSLIRRHEVLRTSFVEANGKPIQKVASNVDFAMEYCPLPAGEGRSAVDKVIDDFIRPFDISRAPLLRACLGSWDGENHLLMVDMHHIVCDGVSIRLFVSDLLNLYEGGALAELNIQYKDYAAWQARRLADGALYEQEHYWMDIFSGQAPALAFPTDYPRPPVQDYEGGRVEFEVPPFLSEKLKRMVDATGTTLNIVLFCTYTILLSRYTGREDLVVGMPSAGRTHADLELLVGMFVNMLPVRCRPQGGKRFAHYLMEVKQAVLEAFENQDFPFDELVDRLGLQRDAGRFPLFDVSFQLGHRDSGIAMDCKTAGLAGGITVEPFNNHQTRRTKLDLVLEGIETGDRIQMVQEYATALFSSATIKRLTRRYLAILFQVSSHPGIRLDDIEIDHGLGFAEGVLEADDASDFNFPIGIGI